ncbi:helix-turn-helix domain-containing protein [Marinomonas sp. M1K-6]|uniref:Helix-turn-helix domain-containing protein n=1 Tax=Marinomonas profundi TaxID=2726122 RepID=A0A847QZ17_9GAMM|nr:LexA family transcriptional regulator [Marinomonas profundi]NLQ16171.1 helix-turn-helix domain-containing protein [Marinomonas profundi]UDV03245.1 helix-turn-helix domain-containing protein [Marinomonas profundi]
MNIADRVKQKRLKLGLTQAELARRVGITQQSLQKIEDGRTQNPRKLLNLSKELHCSAEWLQLGTQDEVRESASLYHNTNETLITHLRPVISSSQAAVWPFDKQQEDQPTQWLETPANTSESAFWLKVIGDSMTSTSGLSVPEGYFILVEPDVKPKNEDLVVAKVTENHDVTFKKLIMDAGQIYLKPLNPNYRPIEIASTTTIIGTVKQARALF